MREVGYLTIEEKRQIAEMVRYRKFRKDKRVEQRRPAHAERYWPKAGKSKGIQRSRKKKEGNKRNKVGEEGTNGQISFFQEREGK